MVKKSREFSIVINSTWWRLQMKPIIIAAENLTSPFEFQGPAVDISKYNKLSIHSLYIEFSSILKPSLIDISTTLTDKTVSNPDRLVATFYQPSSKRFIFFTPTSKIEYKIHGKWLNESYFKIIIGREVDSLKIKNLRLVLSLDAC